MQKDIDVGRHIGWVARLIHRNIDNLIEKNEDYELTGRQSAVVGYIMHKSSEGDLFQKDIEKEFEIRGSSATSMLQLLEDKGFIKRVPVDYDARLKKIVPTEKAVEKQEIIRGVIDDFADQLVKGISEEEIEVFIKTLNKISENAKEVEKTC